MGRSLWMTWTFVLGAMPGFFVMDWYGPVVPGSSSVTSSLVALAFLLLVASAQGNSSLPLQVKWFRYSLVAFGSSSNYCVGGINCGRLRRLPSSRFSAFGWRARNLLQSYGHASHAE